MTGLFSKRNLFLVVVLLVFLATFVTAERDGDLGDPYDVVKGASKLNKKMSKNLRSGGTGEDAIIPNSSVSGDGVEEHGNFAEATIRSFAMIIVSEIGDETFIIAAILSMKSARAPVLAGALAALYFMTVLSAAMGFVMPKLISPELTHFIATFMYFFFGFRLLYIGYYAEDEMDEEFEEVEKSLKEEKKNKNGFRAALARILTPVFIESAILTFLAEWGDRSQIATITLAAHNDPIGVILGGCFGHTICTALAVFGGRYLGTKISQRTVAFTGSFTFFCFAFLNLLR